MFRSNIVLRLRIVDEGWKKQRSFLSIMNEELLGKPKVVMTFGMLLKCSSKILSQFCIPIPHSVSAEGGWNWEWYCHPVQASPSHLEGCKTVGKDAVLLRLRKVGVLLSAAFTVGRLISSACLSSVCPCLFSGEQTVWEERNGWQGVPIPRSWLLCAAQKGEL